MIEGICSIEFLGLTFEQPEWLYVGVALPMALAFRWVLDKRFHEPLAVSRLNTFWSDWTIWMRFLPNVFLILAGLLLALALSKPVKYAEKSDVVEQGSCIVLVLDVSKSMLGMDMEPTRLEAAKEVAKTFVEGRKNDRIGLIAFRGEAFVAVPQTQDYSLLKERIDGLRPESVSVQGTAIGSALGLAISQLKKSEGSSKFIVLLSDGEDNSGRISPKTAAELADAYQIKVYTVGLGREGRVPYKVQKLKQGGRRVEEIDSFPSQLNERQLMEVASIGQGAFFRAKSRERLSDVFNAIDQREPVLIKTKPYKVSTPYHSIFLLLGLGMFIGWMATKSTFMIGLLED